MGTEQEGQKQNFLVKLGVKKIAIYSAGAFLILIVAGVAITSVFNSVTGLTRSGEQSYDAISVSSPLSGKGGVAYNYGDGLMAPSVPPAMYEESAPNPEIYLPEAAGDTSGIDRMVTKNGSLSLLVGNIDNVSSEIKAISERGGGFVTYSNIYETKTGEKTGTVTIKVPSDKFDEAFNDIKKLAIKVETENSNANDVTERYVDLEAQVKNLRAEEEQYVEIMKTAKTVEDTLKVANRLGSVRGSIERIEGQLKYLLRQVEMSTITANLKEEAVVEEVLGIRWRPLFVVRESFKLMVEDAADYADAMIRFLFRLPMILVWLLTVGLLAYVVWRFGKLLKSKWL